MSDKEKIAVTAMDQKGLYSKLDSRFGRCSAFVIVDIENSKIANHKIISNESMSAGQGAGVSTSQTMSREGIHKVITGNIGPNAIQVLAASDIEVFSAPQDITIKEAIDMYLENKLKKIESPTVDSHFGLN